MKSNEQLAAAIEEFMQGSIKRVTHLCADMVAEATGPKPTPTGWATAEVAFRQGWLQAQRELAAMLHKVADGEITIEARVKELGITLPIDTVSLHSP